MQRIHFMSHTGDREIEFDETPELANTRARAHEAFDYALRYGARAFKVGRANGQPDVPVRSFDQLEERTIVVPPITGG